MTTRLALLFLAANCLAQSPSFSIKTNRFELGPGLSGSKWSKWKSNFSLSAGAA